MNNALLLSDEEIFEHMYRTISILIKDDAFYAELKDSTFKKQTFAAAVSASLLQYHSTRKNNSPITSIKEITKVHKHIEDIHKELDGRFDKYRERFWKVIERFNKEMIK